MHKETIGAWQLKVTCLFFVVMDSWYSQNLSAKGTIKDFKSY